MSRFNIIRAALLISVATSLVAGGSALAAIPGISGAAGAPVFDLTATTGFISTPEGGSIFMWGYANGAGSMQYPGPTLIVNVGDVVTVNLTNNLPVSTSIVFPGHVVVANGAGPEGAITREAAATGGTVSYTFTASEPGTYMYHSGTQVDLQIEMGLVGALIVRPAVAGQAYNHADSAYDREFLYLTTEIDPIIHERVSSGNASEVDMNSRLATYWFINGRAAPDTMLEANDPFLPSQPYNCMPMFHPAETVLIRFISAGQDFHPIHTHGNNFSVIARDGRLLGSAPGSGADLAVSHFTTTVTPGSTEDALYVWTGDQLGWDIYGHQIDVDNAPLGDFPGVGDVDWNSNGVLDNPPAVAGEYLPDHGKPIPVILPNVREITPGPQYSGSPYLGAFGDLQPGEGGFNPYAGFTFMWHSHKEKELTNNNIFPGGLLTMTMIVHPDVEIMEEE